MVGLTIMGYEKSLCLSLEGSLHRGGGVFSGDGHPAHTLAAARRNETYRIRRFSGIVGSDQYTAGNNGTPLIGKYAGAVAVTTAKCEGSLRGRNTDLWLGLTLLWLSICSSGPKNRLLQQQRRRPSPVGSTHGLRVRKCRGVLLLRCSGSPLREN
jgi:hypothetical protein